MFFGLIILMLITGLLPWYVAIGLPIYLNKKNRKLFWLRNISAFLYVVACTTIFLAVLSNSGLLIGFALLLGPAAAFTPIEIARSSGMGIAFWTATILAIISSYIVAKQVLMHQYLAVGAGAGAVILAVSIIVQSSISSNQIQAEFERMRGDCLSARPLISSIMNVDNGGQSFHAVMFKGDSAFAWSYGAHTFLPLPEDKRNLKNLAPDNTCHF
jgi:hypothetical protein